MAAASIKGSIFAKLVDDLKKLVERDEAARMALTERLSADEVALLDSLISAASWYSIESYSRMTQILLDFEGHGDIEYLYLRGAESAELMIESGLYAQFDYLNRTEASRETNPAAHFAAFGRDLRILATLSGSILNFSKWSHLPDPDHELRWMLELTDASAYPDLLAHATTGLINRMSMQTRGKELWRWERVSNDIIRFRMTRDL
jgi:hypothetical protein